MFQTRPGRIVLAYCLAGGLWILFSDAAAEALFGASPALLSRVQTWKGWFYILATAAMLHLLLHRHERFRERQERELREREATFRTLFEKAADPILLLSRQEVFVDCNQAALDMLGYTDRSRLVGVSPLGFSPAFQPDGRPSDLAARSYILQAWREGGARFEWLCVKADGSPLIIDVSLAPITLHGEPLLHNTWRDTTLRRQAEETLRQARDELETQVRARTRQLEDANERLRQLDEAKSALLSTASHELRTPLTSVLGFAHLAARSFRAHFLPLAQGDADLHRRGQVMLENLAVVASEGRRLARLVDDLLDLNRIESGRLEWHDELASLPEEMALAVRTMQAEHDPEERADHAPAVSLELDPATPAILADRDRLRQVCLNLLSNAFKHAGGQAVEARVGPSAEGGVEVMVRDRGPGVPPDELERIFEKFHQAPSASPLADGKDRARPRGAGLGLTICRQIVEHYGGRIWAESIPGQGATFRFRLPGSALAPASPASIPPLDQMDNPK